MSDDELIAELNELCKRGYADPETRAKAHALGRRIHSIIGAHYPEYRDWFTTSAEVNMIETIFGVLLAAGETWQSTSVKALAEYRSVRGESRQKDDNR